MIKMRIRFNKDEFAAELNNVRKNRIPVLMANVINRVADSVATTAAREISARTKIPVRDARKRLAIHRASRNYLIADVTAYPYSPNLSKFRATQNKAGVAATAWEHRKTYRHAFINPRTGQVVTRTTANRFPLKGLKGPSVPKTFMRPDLVRELDKIAAQTWRTRMEHEIARDALRSP